MPPIITFFARGEYSWAKVTKNEMWASEVCSACLTWLKGLFVRTLIWRTNAYAGCGRSTLNFIERFWLGLVRSAFKLNSKLNSKCTQMNYEMNCITMHKCTEMYSKQPKPNLVLFCYRKADEGLLSMINNQTPLRKHRIAYGKLNSTVLSP